MIKVPPYLVPGDTVGIVCPAGFMDADKASACVIRLQEWGFTIKTGSTLGGSSLNYFSGTDEERLADFQAMLDDDSVKAILCGRGGYGTSRIIDTIDFRKFKTNPKWIIGYSDITVLHSHIYRQFKTATLHAPMAAAFNGDDQSKLYTDSLQRALTGELSRYESVPHTFNKIGEVEAPLFGGNLSILTHLIGTVSDSKTKNRILFLEDIGEQLYSIDRMFIQLKRAGKLERLAGLILGGFTDLQDTERPFGKTIMELIRAQVEEYDFPVCFGFPVSHGPENVALKIGLPYKLEVTHTMVQLTELVPGQED